MSLNDKQKKRVVAITKQLKIQKGISINQKEIMDGISSCKKSQQEILGIKKQHPNSLEVREKAETNTKKLQNIIDDLNEYMRILHPEGLLEMGSSGYAVGKG
ncbi:MAG: hypothetical protein HOA17_03430 [Candidatus Melainabacteria bacterium]|mgnify:CR=1 FL=1|jgi:DNA repair exonuclease SbcCD ATPase subunit|nr:hypothetical protein [Candidatus Melainabacteria bacterium]